MSKILKIKSCYDCPFIRTPKRSQSNCNHPDFENSRPISNPDEIPSWCPLEDAEAKP